MPNMNNVSICVIVPCYNVAQYVAETVESIIGQPYENVSIVCVNDGSTDATLQILENLREKCSRLHIIDQPNGKISAARNAGIEYALTHLRSDYLMFLDGDDIWYPGWLTRQTLELFRGEDVVAFDFCRANRNLTRRGPSMHTFTGVIQGGDRAVQLDHQSIGASAFRAEFIRETGIRFHMGQRLAEDIDFTLEARSLAKTVSFCEKLVYVYRIRPGSIIQKGMSATDYYTTLFDGWIRSHEFLRTKGFESGCTYGAVKWYLGDFVREMFRQHGSRKELVAALEKYAFCLEGEGTDRQKAEAYLSKFSKKFELLENLKGCAIRAAALIKRLPVVRNLMDRRYYPYSFDKAIGEEEL